MTSDAQRKASAAFVAKRKALGWRKVTLWLSPEALFKLDAMKASAGSKDKAAEAAILAWSEKVPGVEANKRLLATLQARKPALAKVSKPKIEPKHRVDVPVYAPKAFRPNPKPGKSKR